MHRYRTLLRRYVAPQWALAASLIVLLLASIALQLVQPRLLASFIDLAGERAAMRRLTRIAVTFLVLTAGAQLVGVIESYVAERVGLVATNGMRRDLMRHCLGLDLTFHQEHPPGELISRIDGDVAALGNFFSRMVIALGGNVLLLVGVTVMIFRIEWRLGTSLAVYSAIVLYVVRRLRNVARPHWERLMQAAADQSSFLEERLSGTEDIRACGAVDWAMRGLFTRGRDVFRKQIKGQIVGNTSGYVSGALFTLATGSALALGAWLFRRDAITIGTIFLVYNYAFLLQRPLLEINRHIQDLQNAAAAITRVSDVLAVKSAVPDGRGVPIPAGPLEVELDAVQFRYVDAEPVLEDVSMRVEPGSVVGVLGRTGSGKTTITRLLLRFYDPREGTVRIGGVDLRDTTTADLRSKVGLVTQDVQLFQASVRENLTFFDDSVSAERLTQVLDDVGLGTWLRSLPDGLDTKLGAAGAGLSAGEAQLLAFARVFLADPGLVVLDEATSRLDVATELLLEQATTRLLAGRTAIVIAHRLRTVERADDILILDDGQVAEYGPRAELAADPASRFAGLLRTGLEEALV